MELHTGRDAGEQVSVTWDKSPAEVRTALLKKAMLHWVAGLGPGEPVNGVGV